MNCQVFIASYAKDQEWLRYCLMSLKKFSVGFLPPVVGVTQSDHQLFRTIAKQVYPEATIAVRGAASWMAAQCRMMSCDLMCPDADFIFLLGSDCIAIDTFSPDAYFKNGKPIMLYNTYEHLLPHAPAVGVWKKGTERVLGFSTPAEWMRRIPTVHPRGLYAPMRAHVEQLHGLPFERYIEIGESRSKGTSETNILGAYAWEKMHDIYEWINLDDASVKENEATQFPNPIMQNWSWGGLDRPSDRSMTYHGNKNTLGKTPRQLFKEILG